MLQNHNLCLAGILRFHSLEIVTVALPAAVILPVLVQVPPEPGPLTFAPVPASVSTLVIGLPLEQTVEEVNVPLSPWHKLQFQW